MTLYAYRLKTDAEPPREYICAGESLLDALKRAEPKLEPGAVLEASRIGAVLDGVPQAARVTPSASGARAEGQRPRRGRTTRSSQLVAHLRTVGGESDLDRIQQALQVTRPNAQNTIAAAVKAGVVERIGKRTGRVRLVAVQGG